MLFKDDEETEEEQNYINIFIIIAWIKYPTYTNYIIIFL